MPLTVAQLRKDGWLEVLATVFDDEDQAQMLLDDVNYPTARRPGFRGAGNPLSYWRQVVTEIEKGVIPGGLEALLEAAASHFPHHPRLGRWGAGQPAAGQRGGGQPGAGQPGADEDALALWKEKLADLLKAEAIASDAGQKFTLKKQIEEARAKIRELGSR